jgi:hypothetical protein
LLALMLSSHPRIALPPETRFLLPVYRRRHRFGDLTEIGNRRRLARALVRRRGTKFGHLGLDAEEVKKAVVRSAPTIGSAIGAVYRTYAQAQGKARWGDKRPSYFRNIDVLRQLFPDAQFVHLVRDPRDCAASLKRMGWWHHGTAGAVATWVHSVDCTRRAARRLPSGVLHELRYEDLVDDPRAAMQALCDFLGEDFDEAMLTPHGLAQQLPSRQRERWHKETLQQVDRRRIGSYVDVLTPAEVDLVQRIAGARMQRLGYQPVHVAARAETTQRAHAARSLLTMRVKTRLNALRDARLARPSGSVADRG